MRPRYTVIPAVEQRRIEAGDPIRIDIYISGYGRVERNKLYIQQPELLDDSEPGDMTVSVRSGRIGGDVDELDSDDADLDFVREYVERQPVDGVFPFTGEGSLLTRPLDQPANRVSLVPAFFLDDPDSFGELRRLDDRRVEQVYPGVVAEGYFDGHPPIRLKLRTRGDVEPGDYSLKVVFTYGDDADVYQDVQAVEVHVKTPRERMEPIPTLARIAAVAIAVTGLGWTVSPYVGAAVFVLVVTGAVWYRSALVDLFEGRRRA